MWGKQRTPYIYKWMAIGPTTIIDSLSNWLWNTLTHLTTFEDASVMIIEQTRVANSTQRKHMESCWIYTLRMLAPDGLNLDPWALRFKIIQVGMVFYYNVNISLTQVGTRSTVVSRTIRRNKEVSTQTIRQSTNLEAHVKNKRLSSSRPRHKKDWWRQ